MTNGLLILAQMIGFSGAGFLIYSAMLLLKIARVLDLRNGKKATVRLWRFHLHALTVKVDAKASLLLLLMSRISPHPLASRVSEVKEYVEYRQ